MGTITNITTVQELRNRYRNAVEGLTYDNASATDVRAAIAARVAELAGDAEPTPAQWVRAAESVRLPCGRCAATGRFITRVENGVPRGPGGACYRCDGQGTQNAADGHRNRVADAHYVCRSAI